MIIQGLRSQSKLRVVLIFRTLRFVTLISPVCLDFLTCVEISGSNGFSGGSNSYSNGGGGYGSTNGYSGGTSYSGGSGSFGGAGGDKMSNLGANLKTQHWGMLFFWFLSMDCN